MKIRTQHILLFVPMALLSLAASVRADVQLASVFGDSMVLQRELPVPVWGQADPGEKVDVSFAGQSHSAETDQNGKWMVKLKPLKASGEPATMTVSGKNKITLKDILVGEEWI